MSSTPPPRLRDPQPSWMRTGDTMALLLIAVVFVMGFFSYGLVRDGSARALAWGACALLCCWSLIGWQARRFEGVEFRASRWWLAILAAACVAALAQLVPFPRSVTALLSPLKASSIDAISTTANAYPIAIAPEKAMRSVHQLAAAAMFFSGVLLLASRRRASQWLVIIIASAALMEGLIGLVMFVAFGTWRGFGAIYNPNHHATAVAMGLPLYFAALWQWRGRSETLSTPLLGGKNPLLPLYAIGGIAAIGWLASMSRASIGIGAASATLWLLYEAYTARNFRENLTPAKLATGGALLIVAIIVAGIFFPDFSQRFSRADTLSGNSRLLLWKASLHGLFETRGFGLGLGGAEYAINQHAGYPLVTVPIWSHSDWVEWVSELGIPAFLGLCGLGVVAIRKTFAANQEQRRLHGCRAGLIQRAALCGVAIGLVHAGLDFHLRVPLIGFEMLSLVALFLQSGTLLQSRNRGTGERAR
ncbi:hypothetical protein BH09SUM1_BH09SUM1_05510 [soil metagenome]